MKKALQIPEELALFLRNLPPETKHRIRYGLDEIQNNPRAGKALVEEMAGYRSYAIGRLRIIYRIDKTAIAIIAAGPRRVIYKQALEEIGRQEVL